jgi:hypothetical protein
VCVGYRSGVTVKMRVSVGVNEAYRLERRFGVGILRFRIFVRVRVRERVRARFRARVRVRVRVRLGLSCS